MWRADPPRRPGRAGAGSKTATAYAREYPAWVSEPDRAVPVDVPFDRVLIDTPDLVAYIGALHVYPSGFRFTLSSQLRPTASAEAVNLLAEEFGRGLHQPIPAEQAERALRLGVRFADGRACALNPNMRWLSNLWSRQGAVPSMRSDRHSNNSAAADCEVHVAGLPAEGPVTLFYRWLNLGVPEGSVELDGDALRSASGRAVVLWDPPTRQAGSEDRPG